MNQNVLRDIPIIDEDLLDIKNYADALSDFIKSCDTPVTIGIQGDWGIGKTSLLNMIQQNLKPSRGQSKKFIPIKIETWQYAQFNKEEYIALSVINAINNSIIELIDDKNEKLKLKLKTDKFFKTILGVAINVGNQAVKKYTDLDIKEASENAVTNHKGQVLEFEDIAREIEKYKKHFISLVRTVIKKDNGSKLVIMLDDLDRLVPIRALELLEAVKNFLDVERCVFILAVDYSVIEQGMEEKLGKSSKDFYGKSFFDKIIQVPFNMPVSSYRTDKFIMTMFGWEKQANKDVYKRNKLNNDSAFLAHTGYSTIEQSIADYFANIAKITTNNNPRSIKRLINYANLLKIICRKNRTGTTWSLKDAQIVFTIASLQLTWPEIFSHFAENPTPAILKRLEDTDYLLNKIPEAKRLYNRVRDPENTRSKISGFFNQLLMLIDKNGDGEMDTEEFKPIWSILTDTNLTNVKLESIDEQWEDFEKIVLINLERSNKKWTREKVDMLINSFKGKGANWKNPLYFRMLSAGNYFKYIIWDQNEIGTIASTKSEVLQLYLNEKTLNISHSIDEFINSIPKANRFIKEFTKSHYGTGSIKVDLLKIAEIGNQTDINLIMNNILKAIMQKIN